MRRHTISGFAVQTSTASVQMPANFKLKGIYATLAVTGAAAVDVVLTVTKDSNAGVSIGVNGGVQFSPEFLMLTHERGQATAVGLQANSQNAFVPCNDTIGQGEYVYVHLDVSGAVDCNYRVILIGE